MGQILHGCAATTETVRRAIQHSQESLMVLAGRYGINPKTVAKWRKRTHVTDARMGPKEIHSTVLTPKKVESYMDGIDQVLSNEIISIGRSLKTEETDRKILELEHDLEEQNKD